ncbi:hypothetical protein ARMGADRAFT_791359 [Armillaria gallica]|uniref:Uncharacterized protein n=1 Tax=Armillaria gallica TaxID=47427 RepID=A0A2H3DJ38_ARMGA|nr:hypothetical protein ARMGADRAFT_791359 [Armillaria gallica]
MAQISLLLIRRKVMRHGEGPLRNVCVGGSEGRRVTRNESYNAVPLSRLDSELVFLSLGVGNSNDASIHSAVHISPVLLAEEVRLGPRRRMETRREVETDEDSASGAFDLDPSFYALQTTWISPLQQGEMSCWRGVGKPSLGSVTIKGLIRRYVMWEALAKINVPGDLVHGFQGKGDVGSSCSEEVTTLGVCYR